MRQFLSKRTDYQTMAVQRRVDRLCGLLVKLEEGEEPTVEEGLALGTVGNLMALGKVPTILRRNYD